MTKRTITLLALAFTLTGAATANAATTPTPLTPLSLRTERFIITNNTGGTLNLGSDTVADGDTWRQTPTDIPDGGVGDFTLTANGKSVTANLFYRSTANPDYQIEIDGYNPLAAPNLGGCEVWSDNDFWPFTCSVKQDKKGYNDTNWYVTVKPNTTVAAADRPTAG